MSEESETPEGCSILEIANDEDDPDVSISQARVPVGKTTMWHLLVDTDERYIITDGHGTVEVQGFDPTPVEPKDVVLIPAGTPQRITNTGDNDLLFMCVCTPRFQVGCYKHLPTLE